MDITDLRIGQRVAVTNPFDGQYTGTISAVLTKVGPEKRPGVYLDQCEGNPSGLTWAYAEQVKEVLA